MLVAALWRAQGALTNELWARACGRSSGSPHPAPGETLLRGIPVWPPQAVPVLGCGCTAL